MPEGYAEKIKQRDPVGSDDWVYRRGDIYIANLNPFKGSEQGGTRPVLVLQNNDGNFYCRTLIVAPLSSKLKKPNLPTHYLLKKGRGLMTDSIVELEQIKTIDKCRIKRYIGRIISNCRSQTMYVFSILNHPIIDEYQTCFV